MKITISEYDQHLFDGNIHSGKRVTVESVNGNTKTVDTFYFYKAATKYVFSPNSAFIDGYNYNQKLIDYYLICISKKSILFLEEFLEWLKALKNKTIDGSN